MITPFLRGFADAAGLGYDAAADQWAGFSRQLPDGQRQRLEARGYPAGYRQGVAFAKLYRGELEQERLEGGV